MKHFGRLIWIMCAVACAGAVAIMLLGTGILGFQLFQLEWKPQGQTVLRTRDVLLPFENHSDITEKTGSLPFMAGAVIDLDDDGRDEVFLGGGRGQADGLFRYDDAIGSFVAIASGSALQKASDDATMGGTSIDVDGDGDTDLLVARESGIWLYLNRDGRLSGALLPLALDPSSTPLSISPGDVNGDGRVDFYVSGYIRNDLVEGQTVFKRPYGGYSQLFVGSGELAWRDASREYGIWRQHNTFSSVFVDLDHDFDSDLVVAQDTGHVEMYENVGAAPMRPIANPSVNSYPMGIAAGDLNGDGQIDLYFSNVGHTLPTAMLRGDLPADAPFNPLYMLFENKGGLSFNDVALMRDAARLGFGWGVVAADLDLDGWEDLVVAQNYAKFGQPVVFHRYAGKILRNMNGLRFQPVEKRAHAENRLFAISPVVGDFNGDNLPDLIWANLNGPAKAFLNATPGRNVLTVRLSDAPETLGAWVTVEIGGRTLVRQAIASQGLGSDQTMKMMIGLGDAVVVDRISIAFPDGRANTLTDVAAGSVIDWRKGSQ